MEKNKEGKDIEILMDGPICMYYKNSILNEDINWFSNNNFEVFDMNARNWNQKNLHENLKKSLDFPNYYGENLDAFNDCLTDMYNKKYKGLILVFRHYDGFSDESTEIAEALLDIIAKKSRIWLLTSQKLIGLVQSDNPDLHFPELGGVNPRWNSAEWFNSDRKK